MCGCRRNSKVKLGNKRKLQVCTIKLTDLDTYLSKLKDLMALKNTNYKFYRSIHNQISFWRRNLNQNCKEEDFNDFKKYIDSEHNKFFK